MMRAIGRRLSKNTPLLQGAAPLHAHNTPPARNGEGWMLELGKGGRAYASGGRNVGPASSSSSSSERVGDPFKEKRNLLDTAEELLTPRPELKPKGCVVAALKPTLITDDVSSRKAQRCFDPYADGMTVR
jgi:hypothetical protein